MQMGMVSGHGEHRFKGPCHVDLRLLRSWRFVLEQRAYYIWFSVLRDIIAARQVPRKLQIEVI